MKEVKILKNFIGWSCNVILGAVLVGSNLPTAFKISGGILLVLSLFMVVMLEREINNSY